MIPPTPPAIRIDDLHYAYPSYVREGQPVKVLRGVNLTVAPGQFVALLGRVASGKTTLCMALNGLVPHATGGVFRGQVWVAGLDTRRHPIADLARTVGLVFQDPETQLTQMRVEDEIAFGPENLGLPAAEIEARVAWALRAVGLEAYRDRSPLRLSGGEKQRVAIAAMLAMRPQVLVLDEPTANLDPAGKASVLGVLAKLARERRIAILVATQELDRVARHADRVVVLHEGRIGMDAPPAEVFAQVARLQEWGIGLPQAVELGHLLTQRIGRPYRFDDMGQAFRILHSEVRAAPPASIPAALPAAASSPAVPAAPQIMLEAVAFSYPDGIEALRGLNLAVRPGEFVVLLGPNGSGKTTLAKHLNGLLKPCRGRVLIDGRDTRSARVAELARQVGYVFQNPDHQIFSATVADEIAFGPRIQNLPPDSVAQRVAAGLARFRLSQFADLPPALLGSGQRRQVALAAVLATQPQALVLDEPTGGLDARSRQELMEAVVAFNREQRTVILITHDMGIVTEYASRTVVLVSGQVVFDGAPQDLFERTDILQQARLAVPPVVRLARRLQPCGLPRGVLTCAEFAAAWQARLRSCGATIAAPHGEEARNDAG